MAGELLVWVCDWFGVVRSPRQINQAQRVFSLSGQLATAASGGVNSELK